MGVGLSGPGELPWEHLKWVEALPQRLQSFTRTLSGEGDADDRAGAETAEATPIAGAGGSSSSGKG